MLEECPVVVTIQWAPFLEELGHSAAMELLRSPLSVSHLDRQLTSQLSHRSSTRLHHLVGKQITTSGFVPTTSGNRHFHRLKRQIKIRAMFMRATLSRLIRMKFNDAALKNLSPLFLPPFFSLILVFEFFTALLQSTYNSKTAPNIVVVMRNLCIIRFFLDSCLSNVTSHLTAAENFQLRSQPHTIGLHTFRTDKVTLLFQFLCHIERSVKRASHGRDEPQAEIHGFIGADRALPNLRSAASHEASQLKLVLIHIYQPSDPSRKATSPFEKLSWLMDRSTSLS